MFRYSMVYGWLVMVICMGLGMDFALGISRGFGISLGMNYGIGFVMGLDMYFVYRTKYV